MLRETVFENRFGTAEELQKMGAHIECRGNIARIDGVETLRGALVRARDLRGGAALAVAALGAAFAPVLAQCGLYWLVFSGMGILAAGLGQKRSKQICTLFGQGTRLCGAILVLYFFLVILSTLLLLLGGNGG